MFITKQRVYDELGDRTTIWINLWYINYHVGTKWPVTKNTQLRIEALIPTTRLSYPVVKRIRDYDPYIIPDRFYRNLIPVEEYERYLKVKNLIEHRDNLTSTFWYKKLMEELETDGVARHKEIYLHSEDEIVEFFHNYVFDLVDSMDKTGYSMEKGADVGSALIGKNGEIHKAGPGNHRFMVARILGTTSFPVNIAGVHRDWYLKSANGNGKEKVDQIAELFSWTENRYS